MEMYTLEMYTFGANWKCKKSYFYKHFGKWMSTFLETFIVNINLEIYKNDTLSQSQLP